MGAQETKNVVKYVIKVCTGANCKKKTIKGPEPEVEVAAAIYVGALINGEKFVAPILVQVLTPEEASELLGDELRSVEITVSKVIEKEIEQRKVNAEHQS